MLYPVLLVIAALLGGVTGSAGSAGSAGSDGSGGSHENRARGHGRGPTVATSASTGAPGSGPSTPTPSGDAEARRAAGIPAFPSPPVPVPVIVPAGPSAPFLSRIVTEQPVAFITIDDGWTRLPEAVELLRVADVPVTLFLSIDAIKADPGYFRELARYGAVIEAHSMTHRSMKGMAYPSQRNEVCGSADQLGQWYGRRPELFRPPFGNKDSGTLRAVRDCGMKAAFFWTETVNNGVVRYQTGNSVKRGDIILMHFRPAFVADFRAALQAIHAAGLTPALLEDYVTLG